MPDTRRPRLPVEVVTLMRSPGRAPSRRASFCSSTAVPGRIQLPATNRGRSTSEDASGRPSSQTPASLPRWRMDVSTAGTGPRRRSPRRSPSGDEDRRPAEPKPPHPDRLSLPECARRSSQHRHPGRMQGPRRWRWWRRRSAGRQALAMPARPRVARLPHSDHGEGRFCSLRPSPPRFFAGIGVLPGT